MGLDFSLNMGSIKNKDKLLDDGRLYELLIVGAGPAGLSAALYAKRKGIDVAVLTSRKGGQITDTSAVDNYLGIRDVTGEGLAQDFLQHVFDLEVPVMDNVFIVDYFEENAVHNLVLDNGEIFKAKTVLVATGSSPRRLQIPGEIEFEGRGVSYCAICDGPFFKGKNILVSGGGNSAVQAALDMAKVAAKVTLVHRSQLRADKVLVDKLYNNSKITVLLKTKIKEIFGELTVGGIVVENLETNEEYKLQGDGIFIEIGHLPNTAPFDKVVALNEKGEIITNIKKETNVKGIFAAGDVTDSSYKQIIISAGDGAIAALSINDYLNEN